MSQRHLAQKWLAVCAGLVLLIGGVGVTVNRSQAAETPIVSSAGRSETCVLDDRSGCTIEHGFGVKPAAVLVQNGGFTLAAVSPRRVTETTYRVDFRQRNGSHLQAGTRMSFYAHLDFDPAAQPSTPPASTPPATTTTPTTSASPTKTPTSTPTTSTPTTTKPPTTSTPTTTSSPTTTAPTATPPQGTCTSPVWTTSSPDAGRGFGDYYIHNNMWNRSNYNVSQTLAACSAQKWNVTARADNSSGDGAVKTYPNVHKDYHNWSTGAEPRFDSFSTLKSTYGATSPRCAGCIYNVAYDIWLNGVPGDHEVMVWTENWNQRPAGSRVGTVTVAGQSWEFWASSGNHILTFVAPQARTSGQLDIRALLGWLADQNRIPDNATLGQICYGVEVVSTNGTNQTFNFTDFSITQS